MDERAVFRESTEQRERADSNESTELRERAEAAESTDGSEPITRGNVNGYR